MNRTLISAAALSLMLVTSAGALDNPLAGVWGSKGNDTGGIIPWTPENEKNAFAIATANCKTWNKFPVPTSIHRIPGDYIAYQCVWDEPRQMRGSRRVNATSYK